MSARRQTAVRWGAALLLCPLLGALAVGGCGDQRTGLHVVARLSSLQYDELRFGVTALQAPATADGGAPIVVDPATQGRYVAPFVPGDQDVYIYLPDDLGGDPVRCDVQALRASAPIAAGFADAMVGSHVMKDVEVVVLAPGATGAGGASGSGAGGAAGQAEPKGGCMPPKKMCKDGQGCPDADCQ
jgi:hypothetical protein